MSEKQPQEKQKHKPALPRPNTLQESLDLYKKALATFDAAGVAYQDAKVAVHHFEECKKPFLEAEAKRKAEEEEKTAKEEAKQKRLADLDAQRARVLAE